MTNQPVYRRKLALTIGNNEYGRVNRLSNCVNDAVGVQKKLEAIGFQTTIKTDANWKQMKYAIDTFTKSIGKGDLVIFHFSGHGMQWQDQNYIVPIDYSNPREEDDMKNVAINAQHILIDISKRHPYFILFVLDCCRDYVFDHNAANRSRSTNSIKSGMNFMGVEEGAEAGGIIAFACAPGKTASDGAISTNNGLFTSYLLKYIDNKDIGVEEIMTNICKGVYIESNKEQRPFWVSSLLQFGVQLNNENAASKNGHRSTIEELVSSLPIIDEFHKNSTQKLSNGSTESENVNEILY